MSGETRRYVFAPLEQRGVVAGLRAGQVALLGGGLIVATALLRGVANSTGLAGAVLTLIVTSAAAFVPVAGRPLEQWAPTAARRLVRLATGSSRTRSATRRSRRSRRSAPTGPGRLLTAPASFAGLTIGELARPAGTSVGVVRDLGGACLTAVVAVRGRSFTLLDAADKERRLASWSALLAGLSRENTAVRSIQWVERTVPGDAEALVRHLEDARAIGRESPAARSYATLVAEAGPLGIEHECFIGLTVRLGRRRGSATPETALLRELRLLEGQLRSAELDVDHVLSERDLGGLLRTAFDPWARTGIRRRSAAHPDLTGPVPDGAWPAATEESWSWWRTDETWHTTFWVAEWPRSEVGADFFGPLLLHAGGQRTVAVVMAPLPPSAGVREAEAARTAQVADEQLRQRAGFLSTARRRREAEGISRRETELSDGHAAFRFSGYVTVTAPSREALETSCAEVVQAAHQSRLELRRLHGIQDLAFTWTLPLGRGLAVR